MILIETGRPGVPAFDAAALRRLSHDLDDLAFVSVFANRYLEMLPTRVLRIARALQAADVEAALDAALSLKVSSTTVGTCELADIALAIEGNVRRLDVRAARHTAAELPPAAKRADHALVAYLSA